MERFGGEIECFQSPSGPIAYDAFRCRFPGCNARYQRKEHLNRHERSKHIEQQALVCSRCGGEFRRSDTLRRHIQRQHKIREPPKRASKACVRLGAKGAYHARSVFVATFNVLSRATLVLKPSNKFDHRQHLRYPQTLKSQIYIVGKREKSGLIIILRYSIRVGLSSTEDRSIYAKNLHYFYNQ
ncbi:C2H2 type zinc finger domain protein [Penicillium daleae]|uniref:C2H2 type zinc finger domain protein n=1 Tax=Penicillium daleae TaxID=63821 RepID=A0AAD6C979_9EURO|nr:C2H2 type zinc finger domain protein [Penicillium daleae]KAJ5454190.1 C2H2 type zinc finger domain protein [Penicillium daleae]